MIFSRLGSLSTCSLIVSIIDVIIVIIGCVACSNFSQKDVLVVESLEKIRSRHIPSLVREKVWKRDEGRCALWGSREDLELDHIIPFNKGGAHSVDNIRLLCRKCNRRRSVSIGDY